MQEAQTRGLPGLAERDWANRSDPARLPLICFEAGRQTQTQSSVTASSHQNYAGDRKWMSGSAHRRNPAARHNRAAAECYDFAKPAFPKKSMGTSVCPLDFTYHGCPVEFTHELSALKKRRGKLGGGYSSAILRGGNGADDETARRIVESNGEEDPMVGCGRDHRSHGSTMRRWRERLEEQGYSGLVDRRKGQPSDKRVPLARVEEVLRLYREVYFDLN